MKIKSLLSIFVLLPFFMTAQENIPTPSKVFSAYGGFQFQFTGYSDINDQTKIYDAEKATFGTLHLNGGIQVNIPNSRYSFAFEASFNDNTGCPDEEEESVENIQTIVRGHGFKLKQSAVVFEKNGFSIRPTMGIGYQKSTVRLDGDFVGNESGQISTADFNSKSYSKNYYTEIGIGFEKAVQTCPKSNTVYYGANLGYRNVIRYTQEVSNPENALLDLSNTDFNRPVLDFYFRVDLF